MISYNTLSYVYPKSSVIVLDYFIFLNFVLIYLLVARDFQAFWVLMVTLVEYISPYKHIYTHTNTHIHTILYEYQIFAKNNCYLGKLYDTIFHWEILALNIKSYL